MKLLLLTSVFPYARDEPFLENEIPVLAEFFEEVLVVPLFFEGPEGTGMRSVPENVRIVRLDPIWRSRRNISVRLPVEMTGDAVRLAQAGLHGGCRDMSELRTLVDLSLMYRISARHLAETVDLAEYPVWYSYWGNNKGIFLDFLSTCVPGAKNRRDIRKICRMHGHDLYAERSGKRFLPWQKRLMGVCDAVYPCSRQGAEYLTEKYPDCKHKIQYAYLGVAPRTVLNPGSADGILRVASCSSLTPVKRVRLIPDTLAKVKRAVEWIHFGDGPERERVERIARSLPGHIACRFMGHRENREVLRFYENNPVDLFLNVSASEGIPVSIMEAMSFGIEPMATGVGGVPELVKPEFGVLLDPDFRTEELAGIIRNHHHDTQRRQMAREFQREHFSTENYRRFIAEMIHLQQ